MKWYLKVIKQYADFNGRARRIEFWMFTLINLIITILLFLPILFNLISSKKQNVYDQLQENTDSAAMGIGEELSVLFIIFMILFIVYRLFIFLPTLAVFARRLHDIGKSAWWYLIAFVPLGGIVLLVFCAEDSKHGVNRWGPNPKEIGNEINEIGV